MKRNVFKGLQTLICCVVLLLACSTAALAAGSGAVLENGGIMAVSQEGTVPVPTLTVSGTAKWSGIPTNPNNRLTLSGNTLTVNSLPSGFDYEEALVTLSVTSGGSTSEVDVRLVIYNPTYHTFIPVPNASMETASSGKPLNWALSNEKVELSSNTNSTYVRTGAASAKIGTTSGGGGVQSNYSGCSVKEGYDYVASLWVTGTADATNRPPTSYLNQVASTWLQFTSASGNRIGEQMESNRIEAGTRGWSCMEVRSRAGVGAKHARIVGYAISGTKGTLYFDDAMLWEITPAGILAELNDLLAGSGTADEIYKKLTNAALGLSDLVEDNKEKYRSELEDEYTDKGAALTAGEVTDVVDLVNDEVRLADKTAVEDTAALVNTTQTLSVLGDIPVPSVGDPSVARKWTEVSGDEDGHVWLTMDRAALKSRPLNGISDTVEMTLTLSKGEFSEHVTVTTTIEPYSDTMVELVKAAKEMDISSCLNGQVANNITSDLKALPTDLGDGITVTWQALDSATGQTSSAMTAAGKVTRPAYGEADAAVLLRATLSKGGERYNHDVHLIVAAKGTEEARTVFDPDRSNPGFEENLPADDTAPFGWLKGTKWENGYKNKKTSYTKVVTDMAYSGRQGLRITAGAKTTVKKDGMVKDEDIQAMVMNSAVTTAREGYTYTLDVMAYTESTSIAPAVILRFWGNFGEQIANYTAKYDDTSGIGVWKNLHVSAMAPAGTIMITAELDGGTQPGLSWFDDVRLREWPIVANGDFDLDTTGWTTAGTVVNGELTLAAGQTAVSAVRPADRGVTYFLSLDADGGKAALRFVDKNGTKLEEYSKTMTDGQNAFFAYAPAGTAGVQVVLTGAMTTDNVKVTRSATGTGVTDGDFEISATAGVGTPWDLTDAEIAPNTGKTGAGLTVKEGGEAKSTVFPVEDGKGYVFSVDVLGEGTMTLNLYNFTPKLTTSRSETSTTSDKWTTLTISYDQLEECIDGTNPEHAYAQLVLSGEGAVFDNVRVYSTSKNVSNASMENTKITPYGTFPFNWCGYGKVATYVANQEGQSTEGVKSLAVELFGLGQGGVRSSMLSIEAGKSYEATVNAKGNGAKLFIEFWDEDFKWLGSEFATIEPIDSTVWEQYSVIGTAPSNAAYASLSVGGDGKGLVYVDEATLYPEVRSIGKNVQLFLDDWLIYDSQNVDRVFHEGEKMDKMAGHGAYPGIQWDEKEQKFKMWHREGNSLRYRTSEDGGLTWSNATKCIDTATGEVMTVGGYVVIDDHATDGKRYKGIFWNTEQSRINGSYDYWSSLDGINWTFEDPAVRGQDVHTLSYDPINKEFILTYKISTSTPAGGETIRTHSIATSSDMVNWTEGVRMYSVGTPMDTVEQNMIRTDGYGNGVYALGDSYVSLNWRMLLDDADSFGGVLDSNMLFSRDLTEDWQRLRGEDDKAFLAIPRGGPGEWDSGQIYTASEPIQKGNETWWYYYGEVSDHGYARVQNPNGGSGSSYVKWRRNGFASLDFGTNGTMTTQKFVLDGDEVRLNAAGDLTVQLLDANGGVIANGEFRDDSVDKAISWDKDIAAWQGEIVSLCFTSSNAKLYSIQQGQSVTATLTAGECVNGSVTLKNGEKTIESGAEVKSNTTITVDARSTKAGYVVKNVYVNGKAIDGTTFTMPAEDVEVIADFWPEGSIWHEDFDRYDENQDVYVAPLNAASNDSLEWHNFASVPTSGYSIKAVTKNGNKVMQVHSDGAARITLKTPDISGSYIWEGRFCIDPNVDFVTDVRMDKPTNYYVRFNSSGLKLQNKDSGVTGTFAENTWYVVKVFVDADAGTVLSNVYNDDGTLLAAGTPATRTLGENAYSIQLDHYYSNAATKVAQDRYWDYITIKKNEFAVTADECVNGSVTLKNGEETIASGTKVKYGTEITVTPDPAEGYELKAVKVNGVAIPNKGTTFTMPDASVNVTAEFWPEGSIWHEDFDRYDENQDVYVAPLNAASNDSLEWHNFASVPTSGYSIKAVTKNGNKVMQVHSDGAARITLKTPDISGSYIWEGRFCIDPNVDFVTDVRMDKPTNYYVRFNSSGLKLQNKDSGVTGTFAENTWYVVKVFVDADAGTVLSNVYNDDGTLLAAGTPATRTLGENAYSIQLDHYYSNAATKVAQDRYWDYITIKKNEFAVTADECVNGSVTLKNGEETIASGTKVKYGTEITVTPDPAEGYELKAVKVNGVAIDGTTFTMPDEAVTVTADFWPEGTQFEETFEGYTADKAYNYDGKIIKYSDAQVKGSYAADIVEVDGTKALKVSTTNNGTLSRVWLKTNQSFDNSYTIEARFKSNNVPNITEIRLQSVNLPKYNTTALGNYELRVDTSESAGVEDIWVHLDKATKDNILTGGNASETEGQTKELFLYSNGGADGYKVEFQPDNWYVTKIHVKVVEEVVENEETVKYGTVITELYDSTGTNLLGYRILNGATIEAGAITLDHQSLTDDKSGATRETYWDYLKVTDYAYTEPTHVHTYNVNETAATCTTDGYTTFTCTDANCGYSYKGKVTKALGHDWSETLQPLADTETEAGRAVKNYKRVFECQRTGCEETKEQSVSIAAAGKSLLLKEEVYVKVYAEFDGFGEVVSINPAAKGGLLVWETEVTEADAVYSADNAIPGLVFNQQSNDYSQKTNGIVAKEYADELSFRVYVEISDGVYAYGPLEQNYSVQKYCQNMIANPNESDLEKAKQLQDTCAAMLYYGAAAQKKLNHKTEDYANVGIVDRVEWNENLLTPLQTIPEDIWFTQQSNEVIIDNGKSLLLKDKILMKFYFGYEGEFDSAELLVWDAAEAVADGYLGEENVTYSVDLTAAEKAYNGKPEYYAVSEGVAAKDYSNTIFVCAKFTDSEGAPIYSQVINYSPEAYAANKISANDDADLVDLCKRMVMYGNAASLYFAED